MVIRVGSSPILHTKVDRGRAAVFFYVRMGLEYGAVLRRKTLLLAKVNSPADCSAGRSHRRKSHPSHQRRPWQSRGLFYFRMGLEYGAVLLCKTLLPAKADSPVDCPAGRSHRRKSHPSHQRRPWQSRGLFYFRMGLEYGAVLLCKTLLPAKADSPVDCPAGRSHRRKSHPSHQRRPWQSRGLFYFRTGLESSRLLK